MASASPISTSGGTKARAMPWPSSGEKLPLVTTPTGSPSRSTGWSARGGRRPSTDEPPQAAGDARAPSRRPGRHGPGTSPLSQLTTQPEPGLQRGDARAQLVAVQRQAGLEPQGVTGAQARPG